MGLMLACALAAALLAYMAAVPATRLAIAWARRGAGLDHANERSSHTVPTPRLGGVGVAAGIAAVAPLPLLFPALGEAPGAVAVPLPWAAVFATTAAAFAVGLWDDLRSLGPLPKLAALLAVSALAPALGLAPAVLPAGLPPLVNALLAAAVVFALMNMVNFMDGINGMAGRIGQLAALGLLLAHAGHAGMGALCAVAGALCGACMAFLLFNLGDAKTFLGDCGAHAIGAMIACLLLASLMRGGQHPVPPAVYLLLVFPGLFDIGFTMLRRALRGEAVWRPHRSNLYQRHLIATGGDHARTMDWYLPFLATASLGAVALARLAEFLRTPLLLTGASLALCAAIAAAQLRGVARAEALR
ncbi:MAG: glycosyl transferase [Candidatus Sumerlaeia bacterium]|nr:glycosyl transferase [Candidatus Sumerlaeia bacterium]